MFYCRIRILSIRSTALEIKDFESYIHIYYKPMMQFMLMLYHSSTAYTTFFVFTIILAVFFALVSKLIIDSILYANYDLLLYSCTYCSINSSMVSLVTTSGYCNEYHSQVRLVPLMIGRLWKPTSWFLLSRFSSDKNYRTS